MNFSHNEMKVSTQFQKSRHVKHVMKQYSTNNKELIVGVLPNIQFHVDI